MANLLNGYRYVCHDSNRLHLVLKQRVARQIRHWILASRQMCRVRGPTVRLMPSTAM